MPQLFDGDGKPVEAFTQEEMDKKVEETTKETEEAKKEEIDELNKTIQDKEKELEEATKIDNKDKDFNFRKLETIAKTKETEAADWKKKYEDQLGNVESVIDKKMDADKLNRKLETLAGGKKDIADKIRFFYDGFKTDSEAEKDPIKRETAFNTRLENAYILATGSKPTSVLAGPIVSSAGATVPGVISGGKGEKMTEEAKKMAQEKMGVSEDELKGAEEKGLI